MNLLFHPLLCLVHTHGYKALVLADFLRPRRQFNFAHHPDQALLLLLPFEVLIADFRPTIEPNLSCAEGSLCFRQRLHFCPLMLRPGRG